MTVYCVCENCGYVAKFGEIECPRCFADLGYAPLVNDEDLNKGYDRSSEQPEQPALFDVEADSGPGHGH